MNCPRCHADNREGIKFCEQCGAKMELQCANCKANIPLGKKFCGECGHTLTSPSQHTPGDFFIDRKTTKIQRYLPEGLTREILSQRDRIEGEKRQVTVLFCDMEGYTSISEKLGPEGAYTLMDDVYEMLIHKVNDYGGTVNELTGDGIMALFGAPVALEDAPQRAIRSALSIHRDITRYSERMSEEKEIPLIRMRIGIHSGPVVVGTVGNDLRIDFKAIGDTVNIASRVQTLAEPGTTCVTEDTFRLTEGLFRFEALGKKQIKGKEKPIQIYQVIAPSTRRTRFDVSAERGLTPFVGRGRELELLLDGFRRVKAGKGQVFSIVSDAGCGKSRLLYEFRKAVANESVFFLEGKCLSYGRGVAYHPHIDILRSSFYLQEGDGDQQIREKVTNGLKALGVDEPTVLPCLLELLSVKDSGIEQILINPEAKKHIIGAALKQIVLKASEIRPVIIAIEDLHWMDKSSEDIIKVLLEDIPGARVSLIMTYRSEFEYTWGAKSYHNHLTLHGLNAQETLEVLTHILGMKEIEDSLVNLVYEKTEGVPFFIEEFIKSFRDLKIIEKGEDAYRLSKEIQNLTVPSTIQDVIMAKVDSLSEPARELVQTASVIEREFSYALIRHVSALPEETLLDLLHSLKDSELIYERGIYPKSTLAFRHALTREVVYDSILTPKKRRLHERIGTAIEELYSAELEEHCEILARHFSAAENHEKTARYSRMAAKKCEKTGSLLNSIEHTRKCVSALERLPGNSEVQKMIIKARVALGLYYSQILDFSSAKESVDPIFEGALKSEDRRPLSQVHTIMGAYDFFLEDDINAAFGHLGKALRISEEIGDMISLLMGNYWMAVALSYNCEFDKALSLFQKALRINEAANSLWGISIMKSSISYFVAYFRGDMDASYRMSLEAVHLAEKSGDSISKAMAYASCGSACYGRGLFEEANKYLTRAIDECERANMSSWNASVHFCLGESFFALKHYNTAKNYYARAIVILENNRIFPSWTNLNRLALAKAKAKQGEKEIELQPFFDYVAANKIRLCEGPMSRCIGEILLAIDDRNAPQAEEWVQKAIAADSQNGLMLHLGRDLKFHAELLYKNREKQAALDTMTRSMEVFRRCCALGDLQSAEKRFAEYC